MKKAVALSYSPSEPLTPESNSLIIVTGSDAEYFHLAQELIRSIDACKLHPVIIGFFDLGVTPEQHAWLAEQNVIIKEPIFGLALFGSPEDWQSQMGFLARVFLRENFPGYSVYIWLDADVWLQSWDGINALYEGAVRNGAAVVRQNDRAYRFWLKLRMWEFQQFVLAFGLLAGFQLGFRQQINAGIFAMRVDAPHWQRWHHYYRIAFEQTRKLTPHDQFSLNAAFYLDQLPVKFLPATHNWICDLGVPMWHAEKAMFCIPYAPHTPIAILHLAGPAKKNRFIVKGTDGTVRHGLLRFAAAMVK